MKDRDGFTIVEVLVAIMVLGVGVLALVGSSALVTRMIGGGKHSTRAAQLAGQRLELLRETAHRTTPSCTALANGTVTASGTTERWTVTTPAGLPELRNLTVNVTFPVAGGTRDITLFTVLRCG